MRNHPAHPLADKPSRSAGGRLRAATVALLAFALSLCAGELVLRSTLAFDRLQYHYMRARDVFQFDTARVQFDPELGYITRPRLTVGFRNREFVTTVCTNSMGLRDDEASLEDPDVLLLGDSFAFGWGVDQGESVADVLERRTRLRVLDMGVPGYGTLQQYLLLRRYAASRDVSGKLALFLLNSTDVYENAVHPLGQIPYVDWAAAEPHVNRPGDTAFEAWVEEVNRHRSRGVFARSIFADLSLEAVRALGRRLKLYTPPRPAYVPTEADHWQAFGETVRAIRTLSERTGLAVAFVYVPWPREIDGHEPSLVHRIQSVLAYAEIPMIDLRGRLGGGAYFRLDDHWTAEGHARAAAEIGLALRTMELLHTTE